MKNRHSILQRSKVKNSNSHYKAMDWVRTGISLSRFINLVSFVVADIAGMNIAAVRHMENASDHFVSRK